MAAEYIYVPILQFAFTMLFWLLSKLCLHRGETTPPTEDGETTTATEDGETATSIESCKTASDWANLPPELLQLIGRKLTHIADFTKFRCVCSSWRSAVCPTDFLHPQFPWLVFPCFHSQAPLSFFSPSDNRVYRFHNLLKTTPRERVYVIGSYYGWLVTVHESLAVSLLNPITRARIILPPLPKREKTVLPKALICSNPTSIHEQPHQEHELRAVIWCKEKIFFIRHGDTHWGEIEAPVSHSGSMAYFEKRLYVVNEFGGLSIFDTVSLTLRLIINEMEDLPEYCFNTTHLVETRGNLLLIGWVPNSLIQFFWLDRSTTDHKWLRAADGICGITLLTSKMQSVAVRAQEFLNGRGNQVYMFGDETFHTKSAWDTKLVSGVTSTIIELPTKHDSHLLSWMVPSLH